MRALLWWYIVKSGSPSLVLGQIRVMMFLELLEPMWALHKHATQAHRHAVTYLCPKPWCTGDCTIFKNVSGRTIHWICLTVKDGCESRLKETKNLIPLNRVMLGKLIQNMRVVCKTQQLRQQESFAWYLLSAALLWGCVIAGLERKYYLKKGLFCCRVKSDGSRW